MENCPFCGSTDTVYYHFLMNVLICSHCGLSQENIDIDQVEDYLFVDDRFERVSTYTLPVEEHEGSLNYDVLKNIKAKRKE